MREKHGVDSLSDHSGNFDGPSVSAETDPDVSAAIGTDERRMHVRAYNYWCSLLDGRDYPSIEDLDPSGISDFGPHSVLLDFTSGGDDPATPYIGTAIREECGLAPDGIKHISDVPGRSLLSRLTDHYLQIIANRAPVGFEAEFVNQKSHNICYRGILMPFSSDGDTIDFIYGVINWKDAGDAPATDTVIRPALAPVAAPTEDSGATEDEDDALELTDAVPAGPTLSEYVPSHAPAPPPHPDFAPAPTHLAWEDGPLADAVDLADGAEDAAGRDTADEPDEPEVAVDDDAGLADRLWAARESAEVCKQADGRSRAALYRALAMAYDFAVATRRVPAEYAELLDDAGVKAQERAPMTPIVKLVFGVDYDKTRLTEFAAALSHAERMDVDFGGFLDFIEQADGGLKGLVAAERKARRPDKPAAADKAVVARTRLRAAAPLALAQLPTNEEFALVITRRNANGIHEVVDLISDEALLDRALRTSRR